MSKAKRATSNRAVGYVRVSTELQADDGVSLDHQEARVRAYAAATGLELIAVIRDEGVSGGTPLAARNGGTDLLAAIANGEAHHVIALKLDRLFRATVDALNATDEWTAAGVGLHLVDHGGQSINTASAVGRMFLTMLAGFAQFERDLTRERTKAALMHKKASGKVYGHTPYGFDRMGDELIPNTDEQAVMRRITVMRGDGLSLAKIADALNADGLPTKRGTAWSAMQVKRAAERAA